MKSFFALCALVCVSALPLRADERIELTIIAGPEWSHTKWFGPFPVTLSPQIAVWLEDSAGRWAADLFITRKTGKSSWGDARRPEALPVWSHARGKRYPDGLFTPTQADPLPDAVCGATPKPRSADGGIDLKVPLPLSLTAGAYRLMVEVNNSFDFNAAYPETKDNVNGQPSVVYAIPLTIGGSAPPSVGPSLFLGAGDPAGAGGSINPGAAGLESALRIVDALRARYVGR